MSNKDAVIEKIKKLHALSMSNNAGESTASMQAISRLLKANNLSLDDIDFGRKSADVSEIRIVTDYRNFMYYQKLLIQIICRFHITVLIDNIRYPNPHIEFILVGKLADINIAKEVYFYLETSAKTLLKQCRMNTPGYIDSKSFYFGFFSEVERRLKEQTEEAKENYGLMVVDNKESRDSYIIQSMG